MDIRWASKACAELVSKMYIIAKFLKVVEEDVHVRKQSGNVLSYVAVIVKF